MMRSRSPRNCCASSASVGMGVADLRYRAEYFPWACEFVVRFNKRVLSPEQIINLLDTAGFAVGLHEWRPERDVRRLAERDRDHVEHAGDARGPRRWRALDGLASPGVDLAPAAAT